MLHRKARTTALLTTAFLATGGVLMIGAATATAHVPAAAVDCTTWSISGTNYETAQNNTWSVSIDGSTPATGAFGAAFSDSGTFPAGSGDHHLVGHVWQNNDPKATYSKEYDLKTEGCSSTVVVPPVAPTVVPPVCDKATGVLTPGSVTLPVTVGVDYSQAPGKGGVVVTATAQPGFVLVAGGGFTIGKDGTGELLVVFDVVPCTAPTSSTPVPPSSAPPVSKASVTRSLPRPAPASSAPPLAFTGPRHTAVLIAAGVGAVCLGVAALLLGMFGWRRNGNHR